MSILIADNVDVDRITTLKNVAVGNTMGDLIIDGGADRLREVHKVDGTGISIISDNIIMYNFVDIVEAHAFLRSLHCVL
jgi:hypothetical protein